MLVACHTTFNFIQTWQRLLWRVEMVIVTSIRTENRELRTKPLQACKNEKKKSHTLLPESVFLESSHQASADFWRNRRRSRSIRSTRRYDACIDQLWRIMIHCDVTQVWWWWAACTSASKKKTAHTFSERTEEEEPAPRRTDDMELVGVVDGVVATLPSGPSSPSCP